MSDNNENELKYIEPFKYQLLQSFPFIAEDFDQMTAYGLFCRLADKMNEVVTNNNNLNDDMILYIQKFNNLKTYVETYLANLDVQDEINNKLNQMAQDGTLREIMEPYFVSVENQYNQANTLYTNLYSQTNDDLQALKNQVTSIIANSQSTEGNSELIDIRTAYDGVLYATAGASVRNQVSNLNKENENTISKSALNVETTNFGLFDYTPTQFARSRYN